MSKQEYCREMTSEQAYQEDILEHSYRNSGNPDFVKRAEVMQRTFEGNASRISASPEASEAPRTVFEA